MYSKKIALALLLVLPSVIAAQSSQEPRRKKPVKVYTDEDLARVRAKAEKEAGETTDTVIQESPAEPAPAPPPSDFVRERERELDRERTADKESAWDAVRASYQSRYDAVKADLGRIRAAQAECLKNAQYIMAYPAMDDCSGYPPQVQAKQKELEKIENDLLDEARRRGVVPGKARIQK